MQKGGGARVEGEQEILDLRDAYSQCDFRSIPVLCAVARLVARTRGARARARFDNIRTAGSSPRRMQNPQIDPRTEGMEGDNESAELKRDKMYEKVNL